MRITLLLVLITVLLTGCANEGKEKLFKVLSPDETGVRFTNAIPTDGELNFVEYTYVYNGAGVGVGDFNNDGLQDIFFAGNVVSNALYINEGNFQFKDISETAGINKPNRWCTGVALVDINYDGFLDIYVCVADINETDAGRNLLFVNNGDLTFTEQADEYGIDDIGFSTQGAFFDYDKDGDLDLYLLTNAEGNYSYTHPRPKITDGSAKSNDQLYKNTGIGEDGHPIYKNVTKQAGILTEGHGLGIGVADINLDSWPDVYVANDFITNDLVWINNGDGTFYNAAPTYTTQQTHNGMGMDINDFNNDGLPDIYVLDMLPETNYRKKTMLGPQNYENFKEFLKYGYQPQYLRNTLQINNGEKPGGGMSLSEIGRLSGVQSTDWSWAALFADFDHDGYKDLWVTNGYRKDVTNLDYINHQSKDPRTFAGELSKEELKAIGERLGSVKVSNYMFKNNGDLAFDDVTKLWGIHEPSFSNGAAFADFDNDGDLDLVVNNIDEAAFVYKNNLNPGEKHKDKNYIKIALSGPHKNPHGLGAKLTLKMGQDMLYHDHSIYRGYKSTVEGTVHFGIGTHTTIDTLIVQWLDGKSQLITNINANQVVSIDYQQAVAGEINKSTSPQPQAPLFKSAADKYGIKYKHEEADFVDFDMLPLLHHKFSQSGPGIAVGDVDGNGREDFVIGGSVRKPTKIFMQNRQGNFSRTKVPGDSIYEDTGILLFDGDGDDDLDLFVASGSVEFYPDHPAYKDRIYINDGQGNFTLAEEALPEYTANGTVATACDYDKDGDLDLFIGGSMIPRKYPTAAPSYLLENKGGRFYNVTDKIASGLSTNGIVNDALWTDFNGDGWIDLIVAGEWTPVTFYQNHQGKFINVTTQTNVAEVTGWWNSIIGDDFDKDGDVDYVLGNFGLNNQFKPTIEEPLRAYVSDFDNNSIQEAILTYYINGKEYPLHSRDAMVNQMNAFQGRFDDYNSYARATFPEIFSDAQLSDTRIFTATEFASCYFENLGNNKFRVKQLPLRAQFAPVYGMQSDDYDGDGHTDIILVGNSHAIETVTGWQDALPGVYLKGDGQGGFTYKQISNTGFYVDSDAKSLAEIYIDKWPKILVGSNRDSLRLFDRKVMNNTHIIKLSPNDAHALITSRSGVIYKKEFYYGSGYLSQSSRIFSVPENAERAEIVDYQGKKRELNLSNIAAHQHDTEKAE